MSHGRAAPRSTAGTRVDGRAWLLLALGLAAGGARLTPEEPVGARPPLREPRAAAPGTCQGSALPTVTFTLPHFRQGDLDERCGPAIARAAASGFTGVTLIPSIEFLAGDVQQIVPGATVRPGEIGRCLARAFDAGMDIVYMPHLEAAETLRGSAAPVWRGRFRLVPGPGYRDEAFGELLSWARSNAQRLREADTQLFVVVAAELEGSTVAYPEWWRTFVAELRRELGAMGLASRVRIGFNPNWKPRRDPDLLRCASFRAFVRELDFVAPSLYGDWSERWRGRVQAQAVKDDVLDRLAHRTLCDVEEVRERPFAVGEFGLGGDLAVAARNVPPTPGERADWASARAEVYRNFFEWIGDPATGGRLEYVNLWTLGLFDPVLEGTPETGTDPAIQALLLEYTARRCPDRGRAGGDAPRAAGAHGSTVAGRSGGASVLGLD